MAVYICKEIFKKKIVKYLNILKLLLGKALFMAYPL